LFIFYGSDVIRLIDHNIIFGWWFNPIMAISSVIIYFLRVRWNTPDWS